MNILICAGYYSESLNANTKIALNIAKELNKTENCYIAFLDTEIIENKKFLLDGINAYRIVENRKMSELKSCYHNFLVNRNSLFKYCIKNPFKSIAYLLYIIKAKTIGLSCKNYIDCLFDIIKDSEIDKIITFSYPFKPSREIVKNDFNVKKIFYQLDPTGYKENSGALLSYIRKGLEIEAFRNSDFIFTTNILYTKYSQDKKYYPMMSKIIPIEFPNLVLASRNKENNNNNDIYFLGLLDDDYRSPKMFLDFFIEANINSKLVFIGNNYSDSCIRYADRYPNRILIKEPIPINEAQRLLNENHFLLNINNNLKNQSPSKLIDYISTGNPIINVVKNEGDVSLNILNKYDNVYNFYEYKSNDIYEFVEFMKNNCNKRISKKEILNDYYKYTPEFVANEITRIIK